MGEELKEFYKKDIHERQKIITALRNLSSDQLRLLQTTGILSTEKLDLMSENVIGRFELPFSLALNFQINGKDVLIPMVTEEASVVAAASNGARFVRTKGGFHATASDSIMIGQLQITHVSQDQALQIHQYFSTHKPELLREVNHCDPQLISLGGGASDLFIRDINTPRGAMIIVHLLVNVLDAMGANAVNTMVEFLGDFLKTKIPGKINCKILSNLAIYRIAKCQAVFDTDLLGGSEIVDNILDAAAWSEVDPFRAVTHNKGIMNGIIALTMATGNDTRAIEAGAHAYAAFNNKTMTYSALSHYSRNEHNDLVGELQLPLALGIIGGITNTHPMAQLALSILKVQTAKELAEVAVSVGLAQNIAALRALAAEGIQAGHMKLHGRKQHRSLNEN